MSEPGSADDFGGGFSNLPDLYTPPADEDPATPGTDLYVFPQRLPDEVLDCALEGDGTPPDPEVIIDAEVVDPETGLPGLPGFDEHEGPTEDRSHRDDDVAQMGQQRYPGAGGGSTRRGLGAWRRRRQPRVAGATFGGGGGGGGGGRHFSLIGGLNFLSGNRAEVSAIRSGPIASPSVTGINSSGRRPLSTGSRRPYRD